MPFDPVDPKQAFPDLEVGILKYWREEDAFKRSLKRREKGEVFSFYDGPPFATGLPHYGHILAGTIKDVIPRYQTMRGKYVQRRFGWDCHGLPIENLIEKEQGLRSKKDIEALGVGAFNGHCRAAVQRYTKEWRQVVERLGRWVDMDHDYRTMDPEFMESIWWVFKQLHAQGLIYEGHKPMHICPRCATPLSNFEVTQGYKDIQDYSVTGMFEMEESKDSEETDETTRTYFLAWTTTAWTLPGNLFLAVHPKVTYASVIVDRERFIVAKDLAPSIFKGKEYTIQSEMEGATLVGKKYKPLFPYFVERYKDKAFRIVAGDFVTTTDGTGIVHIAPGFGDDDFELGRRENVEVLQHVGVDGCFIKEVTDFAGKSVKPKDDHQHSDKAIAAWLKDHKKLFKSESFMHSYPHCWRCDSPLLNYATSCWFVAVEKIKQKMLQSNAKTAWVPAHIRDGRFGKWLEGARDWAISRNRYWGTPLPIWRDQMTGTVEVIGSRDELMAKVPDRFTKIMVLRHAESEGNVQCIYQGKDPGTSLTQRGQQQAKEAAKRVQEISILHPASVIYCSPLQRTQETARAVAEATGAQIVVDERLREVDFGSYEGKHVDFDDLTFIREKRAHKFETGKVESIFHFDGMETWASTELRMGAFLDEILPKHRGQSVVIVTHADLVMNAVHYFTGEDPQKIVHQPYPTLGGIRTFFWDHERKAQMDLHKETVDGISWRHGTWNMEHGKSNAVASNISVELTLVRHGETNMNKKHVIQGSEGDEPLNATGKKQAKETAEALKGQMFDLILCSDLKRARQTAEIIAKELNHPIDGTNPIFRERNLGDTSGKSIEDAQKMFNAPKGTVGTVFLKSAPKNGETFDQFMKRMEYMHDLLLREFAGKRVLVVAHSGVLRAFNFLTGGMSYDAVNAYEPKNASPLHFTLTPQLRRIPDVLDCWFESGSMPYAQDHFPFETGSKVPLGFPADFIAEGLDQTRGWFYTLMVLSSALFECPPFRNCIVNGIVLAPDGKKMSKKLKNYPEPTEIVQKHGADAVRFALMSSPAVRGEDLRFSEALVQETVRAVLLPLWNAYRLFVTYANAANFKPSLDFSLKNASSKNELDRWILSKTQELVNKMTAELDRYDLSATCAHLADSIDDLTNWYVRLSRRRLAGKSEGKEEASVADQADALDTLYRVLLCNCQLLAPLCPFITEDIYLNLVAEEHGSIHFTDWPASGEIATDDRRIMERMDATRTIVTLGLSLRSEAKIKVRQPLTSVTIALPPGTKATIIKELIMDELNVKQVIEATDASSLGTAIALIDARKAGPRLGGKIQELIKAGKAGQFTEKDGMISVQDTELLPEEVKIVYQGKEGKAVACGDGIVVSMDTKISDALKLEGQARELIHAIQQHRKDAGMEFTDTITLSLAGADAVMAAHGALVLEETRSIVGACDGPEHVITIDDYRILLRLQKRDVHNN